VASEVRKRGQKGRLPPEVNEGGVAPPKILLPLPILQSAFSVSLTTVVSSPYDADAGNRTSFKYGNVSIIVYYFGLRLLQSDDVYSV